MIERVIEWSIRRRGAVIFAGLALAVAGAIAAYHTPVDAIPNLSENQVIVFSEWPGHSPREIEDQVAYPLSLGLQGLAGVRVVRSSSEVNFALIDVILEDDVDFYFARDRISERLSRLGASLPAGATANLAPDAVATGQIFWYTVEGDGFDPGRLRAVQDFFVKPQLASVPGVAEVASVGGYAIEYQVELDPQRLAAAGLTPDDVRRAVARANEVGGGHVLEKGNAEFLVRTKGWLGAQATGDDAARSRSIVQELEQAIVPGPNGTGVALADVARVSLGAQARRGVLEKDGRDAVGGVILMRYGQNPLEVTRNIKRKIQELQAGLPEGMRIAVVYDRTPLIESAIATVTGALGEAILTATVCVLLVLLHFRTSIVIAVMLPLSALCSFLALWLLRWLGWADIQTNVMSLAGIAISIGVLVDSSIVMAENAMHRLKEEFGDRPVRGDVRQIVLPACRTVGRPIFFSVAIMLISFLPVFSLGGMQGKMFHPLAFTKSFALAAVAALSITLAPALCTIFIKGKLRAERDSWLVRSLIDVYRPVLSFLLDKPAALAWIVAVTFLVGLAPLGADGWFRSLLAAGLAVNGWLAVTWLGRVVSMGSLLLVALVAQQTIAPLERSFMSPLDEGMVMDMPISVPRMSVTQAGDDLRARDMMLCRFPEVSMVAGKAGRAESPADPAPLDMIETMVDFRPRELWPRRKLSPEAAARQAANVLGAFVDDGLVAPLPGQATRDAAVNDATMRALVRFDAVMREYAYQRNQELLRQLGRDLAQFAARRLSHRLVRAGAAARELSAAELAAVAARISHLHAQHLAHEIESGHIEPIARHVVAMLKELGLCHIEGDPLAQAPPAWEQLLARVQNREPADLMAHVRNDVRGESLRLWRAHVLQVNAELLGRAAATFTHLAADELLRQTDVAQAIVDEPLRRRLSQLDGLREAAQAGAPMEHRAEHMVGPLPTVDPHPAFDAALLRLTERFGSGLLLWPIAREELRGFGGELDRVVQMPGWTNVWTMPIQNRVDMLATGVNTAVGIRVLGRDLDDVVLASERIAATVKRLRGAADVVADPVRGKGYLEVQIDREKAARLGVSVGDIDEVVETALGGRLATTTVEGRERHPVRIRFARVWRDDEEALRDLLAPVRGPARLAPPGEVVSAASVPLESLASRGQPAPPTRFVPLDEVANVRIVEGPASIKSENGLLRNYVRLNVKGRGAVDFVEEARRVVAAEVDLPEGVFVEWTGQFEHERRSAQTLQVTIPLVIALIFGILWWTYLDLADACTMMLAVPGALAGGMFFQSLFGYDLTVTVWVGYIACFGMATSTGIIMLVYLREAVDKRGGLEKLSLPGLREAVLEGAVHRLRPKLLTEATTLLGLAPMLWAEGTGAEIIRPMAVPVLGGILVADEVIDLLLPVLFYWIRRWRWQRMHRGEIVLE